MPEERYVDSKFFADTGFELSYPAIFDVLRRIDGATEPCETADGTGIRVYRFYISEKPGDESVDMESLHYTPVDLAKPPVSGDSLLARAQVVYNITDSSAPYAQSDSFIVRFTEERFEIFTDELEVGTSPTEIFDRVTDELEAAL